MRRLLTAGARWRAALFSLGAAAALALSIATVAHAQPRPDDRYLVATWGEAPGALFSGSSEPEIVRVARRHIGATARDLALPATLWCADFTNLVRREVGFRTVPSRVAHDQMKVGKRLHGPAPGAIVDLSRGRSRSSGHTGVVSRVLANGDIVVISGNSGSVDRRGRRVTERVYPRARALGFVDPSG